ncbi:MAG: hypothetical protein H6Q58_1930 [Firmicutes bacterium]|nr:hypothetical protein [Bacillota bacterium]
MGDKFMNRFRLSILAMASVMLAYNVYDNNRITVKEQVVYIDNLPQEFDGFRILQVSDLHGKRFGKDQSYLVSKVNGINYDMIAFTGDMEIYSNNDLTAFVELLKGINNKKCMFYVNGNDDVAYSSIAGNEADSGEVLQQNGCMFLTKPHPIKRADKTLWITNYFKKSAIDKYKSKRGIFMGSQDEYVAYREYLTELEEAFHKIKENGDIKVLITHIPFTRNDFDVMDKEDVLDFSLVLAGHYHGGQIRIPFYGALFIPGSRDEERILFPKQNEVSGLAEYNGIQQYISTGLGASIIPFRLFDTPEINLIILKTK